MLERYVESLDKKLLRNGRRCEVLREEIARLQDHEVTENMQWFKVGFIKFHVIFLKLIKRNSTDNVFDDVLACVIKIV